MKKVIIILVSLFVAIAGTFWVFKIEPSEAWRNPISYTFLAIILFVLVYFFLIPKFRKRL